MIKKLKVNRQILLLFLIVVFAFLSFFALDNFISVDAAKLSDVQLGSNYTLGTKFTVPTASFNYDDNEYVAETKVIFPNGKNTVAKSIVLSEVGEYIIEYSVNVGGKSFYNKKTFNVYDKSYNFENATYGNDRLTVTFDASHKSITFNQPFNISNNTKDDLFCAIDTHTLSNGLPTAGYIYITLTDVYDADNYIKFGYSMHESYYGLIYSSAGFSGQSMKGAYTGYYGSIIYQNSMYGLPTIGNFYSSTLNTGEYYIDYQNKAIHAGLPIWGTLVCDFDDVSFYSQPWEGFSTGDVIATVSVDGMLQQEVVVDIRKMGTIDLSQNQDVTLLSTPKIDIDLDGYDEDNLPFAVKGNQYKVFNAIGYNGIQSENILPRVFYGYKTASENEADVIDGYFITDYVGDYSLVYSVKTSFNEVYERVVTVNCKKTVEELKVEFEEDIPLSINVGENFVFPNLIVENNDGRYSVEIFVKNGSNGGVISPNDGIYSYFPWNEGTLTITVKATDYINRVAEKTYNVNVLGSLNDKFIDYPTMPHYLFEGYSVKLPEAKVYNFSTQNYVTPNIYISDKDGERLAENGYVTPYVVNSGDNIEIIYRTNTVTKSYQIPVLKVGEQGSLDLTKYFIYQSSISLTKDSENFEFETSENQQKIEFANKLLSSSFSFIMKVNENKNHFNRINVYLTDSIDSNISIKVSLIRDGNQSKIVINDDAVGVSISPSFTGATTTSFAVNYNEGRNIFQIDGKTAYITTDINGNDFNGFTSNYLYFTFEFEGVTGSSAIKLYAISSQVFSSDVEEYIKPSITYLGDYGGYYKVGDTYKLPKICAGDVLSTNVNISYKFTYKVGTKSVVAYATDGTKLEGITGEKEYNVVLSEYGTYTFSLTATDQNGNIYKTSYQVYVIDGQSPTIKVNASIPKKASAGSSIDLSKASVSDDSGKCILRIFVFKPDGTCDEYKSGEYKFNSKGRYRICYYAYDEAYNTTTTYYEIIIK